MNLLSCMKLSSRIEYALLALLEIACRPQQHKPLKATEIASHQGIAIRYLDQILSQLRQAGMIQSHRGATGGYLLAREPSQITLLEVINCVGGSINYANDDCVGNTSSLDRGILSEIAQQSTQASQSFLAYCTLQDLLQRRQAYSQGSPMYFI